jgi:hypothetical protein
MKQPPCCHLAFQLRLVRSGILVCMCLRSLCFESVVTGGKPAGKVEDNVQGHALDMLVGECKLTWTDNVIYVSSYSTHSS